MGTAFAVRKKEGFDNTLKCSYWRFFYILVCFNKVRSLSAKYRPDRYRRDKSVKFGTELPSPAVIDQKYSELFTFMIKA